jgi:alpha-1,6-mannosyltransferase
MPYKANFQDKFNFRHGILYALVLVLASIIAYIGYHFGQKDFFNFLPYYSLAFLVYIFVCRNELTIKELILIAIFVRLGLVFTFPALSDDIYRFYWDGRLIVSGISPYGILPSEVVNLQIPYLDVSLYNQLNSPLYYTIYPPVNQLYFAIAAWFGDIIAATIVLKILFIITEILGLYYMIILLKQQRVALKNAAWYILNPLVIIEGVGNLHFEVVMVSFFCISIYYILNNKIINGSVWLALSIGIKLLPLILLPYFWFKWKWKYRWYFFGLLAFLLCIIFIPVLSGFHLNSFLNSIDLYFRKFEFNASIYYVLRYIGHQITGYNLIHYLGPTLATVTIGWNIFQASKQKESDGFNFMNYSLLVWSAYLFLATTVHPWYIISILFFSIFTKWKYPIVWSYLIIISYINYSFTMYYENLWWIALEYILLLIWLIWERKYIIYVP